MIFICFLLLAFTICTGVTIMNFYFNNYYRGFYGALCLSSMYCMHLLLDWLRQDSVRWFSFVFS